MKIFYRSTQLALACAVACGLFAGSVRGDDPTCNIRPAVVLPEQLASVLSQQNGTLWLSTPECERAEHLGDWEYVEANQAIYVWTLDGILITIDLSYEEPVACCGCDYYAVFHFTKTDPASFYDPTATRHVLDEGEIWFSRGVPLEEPAVDELGLAVTEVVGDMTMFSVDEWSTIRFVGVEPAICIE